MLKNILFYALLIFPFVAAGQYVVSEEATSSNELERHVLTSYAARQSVNPFMLQFSVNNLHSADKANALYGELDRFLEELSQKKQHFSSDKDFLEHVYFKVHRKYLRHYSAYSSFNQLMEKGTYDCLSATILYALVLERLGIPYTVYETEYHVFLMARLPESEVLIESTDAIKGFVSEEEEVAQRLASYRSSAQKVDERTLRFSGSAYKKVVSLEELAGLQYFNASVEAIEEGRLVEAITQLTKARLFYDSSRFTTYGKYLARLVVDDAGLTASEKQHYLLQMTRFLNEGVIFASR